MDLKGENMLTLQDEFKIKLKEITLNFEDAIVQPVDSIIIQADMKP